ncbi:MAG: hypothetical protein PHU54_07785 [Candidatus Omnitrophica bacterium]|nr:hypothetical protein [Candidatus Omnitrophota bacterium]
MTTYAGFVGDLVDMSVTGQTSLSAPPASITGKTPVRWPMLPSGEGVPVLMGGETDEHVMRVEIQVAMEAVGQNTMPTNYAAVQTGIDNLEAALKTLDQTSAYGLRWTITGAILAVGGVPYWGLTCLVTATEYV